MSNRKDPPPGNASRARPMSPVVPANPTVPAKPGAESLEVVLPKSGTGARSPTAPMRAAESGGSSRTEDTSRGAGYVADLTKANEPPPGPPVAKSPENFAGQSGTIPTEGEPPPVPTPNTTPPSKPGDVRTLQASSASEEGRSAHPSGTVPDLRQPPPERTDKKLPMTNPTPSDHDKKRDASTLTGQPQRGGPVGAPAPTSKDADLSRSGSKTTEILKAATAGRPAPSHGAPAPSPGARVDAKSPNDQGRRDPSSRSDDASSVGHADRAQAQAKDGSREDGSRRTSGRDEGLANAVRSLIACCDQLVREIPRGAAARFDGVNAELSKARSALDQGSASQGAPAKSASRSPSSSPSSSSPSGAPGTTRTARPADDESSDSHSAPASM